MIMMYYINARFLTQPITGVQRFAIEISKELKKLLKDEVRFISSNGILYEDLASELNVKIIGRNRGHIWEQIDLPFYLNQLKGNPILINLTNTAPILYKNKISTLHDIGFIKYPKTYSKKFVIWYKFLIPLIIKTSKQLITVSNFSKSEILENYNVKIPIDVIYNAVGKDFSFLDKEKESSFFLAVSSLNYRKNFIGILKAFVLMKEKTKKNIHLTLIGDVKTDSFGDIDISEFLKREDINVLGRVSDEDLVKYYQNAIAFVYPSFYEGFGIPPLEAQTCGTPVIVSNKSSLPEVFEDSALYCDPSSIDEIAEQMIKLGNSPILRKELSEKGFQNTKRFSWENSAKELLRVIKKN
jgi:glycosyltransferase involved in cell wall biosynthesis